MEKKEELLAKYGQLQIGRENVVSALQQIERNMTDIRQQIAEIERLAKNDTGKSKKT